RRVASDRAVYVALVGVLGAPDPGVAPACDRYASYGCVVLSAPAAAVLGGRSLAHSRFAADRVPSRERAPHGGVHRRGNRDRHLAHLHGADAQYRITSAGWRARLSLAIAGRSR